jgi:hypothetical protein
MSIKVEIQPCLNIYPLADTHTNFNFLSRQVLSRLYNNLLIGKYIHVVIKKYGFVPQSVPSARLFFFHLLENDNENSETHNTNLLDQD